MTVQAEGTHPNQPGHLDELSLDAIRAGEATRAAADHLATCATCQARQKLLTDLESALTAPLPRVEVPPERDAAILALAGTVAERIPSRRRWTRVALPAAIAGAVAAAAIAFFVLRTEAPNRPGPSYAAGDLNHDRHVDILDAFSLARAIERGDPLLPECDLNGDQVIDRSDVDAAARTAVSLGGQL